MSPVRINSASMLLVSSPVVIFCQLFSRHCAGFWRICADNVAALFRPETITKKGHPLAPLFAAFAVLPVGLADFIYRLIFRVNE